MHPGTQPGGGSGVQSGHSREQHALLGLHELLTAIHSGGDLGDVLQRAAQGVVDVLGFQVAVIDCLDPFGYVEALAVAGDTDACAALKGRRLRLEDLRKEFALAEDWGLLKFVPHDRLPEDADYSWVPEFEPLEGEDAWHPMDSLYALLQGPTGELVGMLSVDLPVDLRRPGLLSRQVLEMYAVQAGLAIYHAQERQRLQERVRLAAATRRIVETASREPDFAHVLDSCFAPLVAGFATDRVVIRIFDGATRGVEGQRLSEEGATYPRDLLSHLPGLLAGAEGDAAVDATRRMLDLGRRIAQDLWPRRRTMLVAELGDTSEGLIDAEERQLILDLVHRLGGRSFMLVPVGAGLECLGYIVLMRESASAYWTDAENAAALEVGREIGRVVHSTRLFQRERELVTELQELDRYKVEMIHTITHELKNPLTAISGHAELLADDGVAPLSVDAIGRNVRRLLRLVDDLLLLGNVRDLQRPFAPVSLDLSQLVIEVCDLLSIQAARRHVEVDTSGVDPAVHVRGEQDGLLRMLANVIGNAIKFTPDGGQVVISARRDRRYAEVVCADTGIGIPTADFETLFDEFDRGTNPAAHAVPGTGLGLAIVKRIVERHQGQIAVESTLGAGSTFRLQLPAPTPLAGSATTWR